MSIESTVLPMLRPDGAKVDAKVEWEAVKYGECRVSINCDGKVFEGRRIDYFDALEEARLPFEADGYRLLCYGASLNVFPSGMGRSCGLGMEHGSCGLGMAQGTLASNIEISRRP